MIRTRLAVGRFRQDFRIQYYRMFKIVFLNNDIEYPGKSD